MVGTLISVVIFFKSSTLKTSHYLVKLTKYFPFIIVFKVGTRVYFIQQKHSIV